MEVTLGRRVSALAAVGAAAALAVGMAVPWDGSEAHDGWHGHHGDDSAKLLFFTSDGMRQDAIEKYADQGVTPGFRDLLKHGAYASDHGLLTQAPPNTGAGWYTLTTGTWPAVHGSTNNTFYIDGSPFDSTRATTTGFNTSTSFSSPNVLQAETLAQAAKRGGKKVAQIEWAGGRSGSIQGPTLDFRSFLSGRGVGNNYTESPHNLPFAASLGLQFDQSQPVAATGWTGAPASYSPAKEMHLRVLD